MSINNLLQVLNIDKQFFFVKMFIIKNIFVVMI